MSAAEVAKVAASLTKAQREGLLRKPCRSWWGDDPACMPHREATAFALKRKGLCVGSGADPWPLTPLGLAVRQHLERTGHEQ